MPRDRRVVDVTDYRSEAAARSSAGTIPIVNRRTNPLVATGLYSGVPVVIVDEWAQLASKGFLEQRHAELVRRFGGRRSWDRRWLWAEGWVERVREAARTGAVPLRRGCR